MEGAPFVCRPNTRVWEAARREAWSHASGYGETTEASMPAAGRTDGRQRHDLALGF
jgi:hypothetical protein